jgi:F5/8 type C domain
VLGFRTWPVAAAAAAFVCLSLLVNRDLLAVITRGLAGNLGDPMLNAWILGWVSHSLATAPFEVWNAPNFYPHNGTLALSENLIGQAIFVAPVYWLTHDAILTHNVAFLASIALIGVGAFILVRCLIGRVDAAWLAGVLAVCSPYFTSSQLARIQTLSVGWSLLTLAAVHVYLRGGNRLVLAGVAAAWSLQLYSNTYLGIFLAVPVGCVVVDTVARRRLTRTTAAGLVVAAALSAAVSWPVVSRYRHAAEEFSLSHSDREVRQYSASPAAYVSVWYERQPRWLRAEDSSDQALFPGVVASTLLLAAPLVLWRAGRSLRWVIMLYGAMAAVVFLFTLGPSSDGASVPSLYDAVVRLVPAVGRFRAPGRFAAFTVLAVVVVASCTYAVLSRGWSRRWRYAAAGLLTLAGLWDVDRGNARVVITPAEHADATAAYRWLATQPPAALFEMPAVTDYQAQRPHAGASATLRYQLASLSHGHRLVNGSSGYSLPFFSLWQSAASPFASRERMHEGLEVLRAIGTRYLLLHTHEYLPEALPIATALLERLRADTVSVEFVRDFGGSIVVALRPAEAFRPFTSAQFLDRRDMSVTTSHNGDVAHQILDGRPHTRWTAPQYGHAWVEVLLAQPTTVDGTLLQMVGFGMADYPRHLRITATDSAGVNHVVYDRAALFDTARQTVLEPHRPGVRVTWAPLTVWRLRIEQPELAAEQRWAIYELELTGVPNSRRSPAATRSSSGARSPQLHAVVGELRHEGAPTHVSSQPTVDNVYREPVAGQHQDFVLRRRVRQATGIEPRDRVLTSVNANADVTWHHW